MTSKRGTASGDPLIDEVRERRRQLLADVGFDWNKLLEAIQALQAEHPEKLIDRRIPDSPPVSGPDVHPGDRGSTRTTP